MDQHLARQLVSAAARLIISRQDELSRLDAIAGDGDHGVNMASALAEAVHRLERSAPGTLGTVFRTTGQAFHSSVGGAAGALFGAFFGALGTRLDRAEHPDATDLVQGIGKGLARVIRIGRTERGQKTMVDALGPAAESAAAALESGEDLGGVIGAAARAARAGAAATAGMKASAGRARYAHGAGEGTEDPGACTVALIFEAWAEELDGKVQR